MLFPNKDYLKTMLNGISARFKKIEERAVQGDWQENDASKGDYVKNRPGGYDVVSEEVVNAAITYDVWTSGKYKSEAFTSISNASFYWVKISSEPITFEEFQDASYSNFDKVLVPEKIENLGDIFVAGGSSMSLDDKLGAIKILSFVITKPGGYGLLGDFSLPEDVGVYINISTTGLESQFTERGITYTHHITTPQVFPEKYLPLSSVLLNDGQLASPDGTDITDDVTETVGGKIVLDYVSYNSTTGKYSSNKTYEELVNDLKLYGKASCGVMYENNFYQFVRNIPIICFSYEVPKYATASTFNHYNASTLTININNTWEMDDTTAVGLFNASRPVSMSSKEIPVLNLEGKWITENLPVGLPTVSGSDNGKILQVVDGEWKAVELTNANGVNF